MSRWRIKEDWEFPLILFGMLGWLPLALALQAVTVPDGLADKAPVGLGFILTVSIWLGTPLLAGAIYVLAHLPRWLKHAGLPIERTTPRVDPRLALQRRIRELEHELEIGADRY